MAFATMDQKLTSGKNDGSNSTIIISSQNGHLQLQTESCVQLYIACFEFNHVTLFSTWCPING